ncbi:MAG: creatininase family protein [Candidatus Heimdallarchaeota archaeon]|nr:creatininase family protein [Candidatus Heimdallarchaeota archaeon]
MFTIRIEEMNWQDIKAALDDGFETIVVAVGSIEQHGPHLPTQTDALIGDMIANRVAVRLKNTLQAPTIRVGCSDHHLAFPGTISLKEATLKNILGDYVKSLVNHGFKRIIFLPSHGGNFSPVKEAIDKLQVKYPETAIIGYTDLQGFINALHQFSSQFDISKEEAGVHAGESETSLVLALAEELVEEERFTQGYLGPMEEDQLSLIFNQGMTALTDNGILGDPTKASIEKGEKYLEELIDFLVGEIQKMF